MLPGILAIDIDGFAKANEKVWYVLRKDPNMIETTGTEFFFELKNKRGNTIAVSATDGIFKMYRVK